MTHLKGLISYIYSHTEARDRSRIRRAWGVALTFRALSPIFPHRLRSRISFIYEKFWFFWMTPYLLYFLTDSDLEFDLFIRNFRFFGWLTLRALSPIFSHRDISRIWRAWQWSKTMVKPSSVSCVCTYACRFNMCVYGSGQKQWSNPHM